MKVLPSALLYLVWQAKEKSAWHHISMMEIIAICITKNFYTNFIWEQNTNDNDITIVLAKDCNYPKFKQFR